MEPIFNDKVRNFCYKLAQGLTKVLVHVGRIQSGGIGTFQDRKLCMETCFNLAILINFADFSGVLFFCPKCANTSQNCIILSCSDNVCGALYPVDINQCHASILQILYILQTLYKK